MDLLKEQKASVIYWTIARAHRKNALGDELAEAMSDALSEIEEQWKKWLRTTRKRKAPIQALVIDAQETKDSSPIWIAGGDLNEHIAKNSSLGKSYAQKYMRICKRIEELPVPSIMKIHGGVIGGGVEFALSSDLRFASEESYFDFRQLQIGLATGYGGAKRLVESVGKSRASYLLLTSQRISASQALDWGLIHELAPTREALDSLVDQHITKLCTLEPLSIAAQKKMLAYASHSSARPELELKLFKELWKNPTHLRMLEKFR